MGNQNIERIPQLTFLISTYVSHSMSPNPLFNSEILSQLIGTDFRPLNCQFNVLKSQQQ